MSIDIEFPSVVYPWLRVSKETGAEVRLVRRKEDPESLRFEDVAALVDKKTSVICVSHVQYATGHRFNLKDLAGLAHANGAILVVDVTHSAGVVPIDVSRDGVDALVAAAYKWLRGPFGVAILYVAPALAERLEPVFVGWRGTADMWGFDATELTYAPSLRRFEFSTMSYMSGYGLGEALRYVHSLGVKSIFDHDLGLAGQLIEGLERLGARALTPREPSRRSGIVTARFPGRNGEKMAAELNRRKVVVSPRFGSTRFSPHFFNGSDEIEQALSVLAGIL